MRHARRLGIIFACLLYVRVIAAEETPRPDTETLAHGFEALAPLFDTHQWTAVQSALVRFGKEHPDARVQLLKSITPTGQDGIGRLLFYMDDIGGDAGCPLELRDVTGDQVPEIIFHSGWMAASDHETDIHILQYVNGPTKFRDIRGDHFFESWWWKFRWLDLDGRTVAIVAEPVERSEDPEVACHACPKFHKYRVSRWDQGKGSFVLSETIPSTGKLHADDEDPLTTDWLYIVAQLKKG
jgi:hypothetical protein